MEDRTFEIFMGILEMRGPASALAYLNDGVPHRYSGIYRLDRGVLRSIHLHDKHGEILPTFLAEVPLGDSFCQFVLRDGIFRTDDSARDARLDGHPYQGKMISYHGVPLKGGDGKLLGSMCHFDTRAMPLSDEMFQLMYRAADFLPKFLVGR